MATAELFPLSIIAHHVDQNELVGMASLDLSVAFDMVNIKLLQKRLKNHVHLIKLWLEDRSLYDGKNSMLLELLCETVQESILGPILYAIFVSPLFDLHNLTNFADDNFKLRWSRHMPQFIADLERSLEAITKWLRGIGLAVNDSKTKLCLFHLLD
jgi:hypothetical protein